MTTPPHALSVETAPGRFSGKVALVTGAARGQGRSHAVRLASEGADIIAFDIAASPSPTLEYPAATPADLTDTVSAVQGLGRRIVARAVDTRDLELFANALTEAVEELGGTLDIVVANAGIVTYAPVLEVTPEEWQTNVDVNLTGTWHTVRAALPHILRTGAGGSIIMIGSVAASRALPFLTPYNATKSALLGLCRALALELGPKHIRVNTVNPAGVNTAMSGPNVVKRIQAMIEHADGINYTGGVLPRNTESGLADPEDISNAVAFLASDESRFVTGQDLFVDFGRLVI